MNIELNKKNQNPFYGLKYCLSISSGTGNISYSTLNNAWDEVKNDVERRKMFFSILFSIGDITNRHHNIFGKNKIDNGGNAARDNFRIIFRWLRAFHYDQFKKFMFANLFNEYISFDLLLENRVVTKKNSQKVIEIKSNLSTNDTYTDLIDYLVTIIKGDNTFNKHLVAKFLTLPRLSKRQSCKRMLPETQNLMIHKQNFLNQLSEKMNWETKPAPWGGLNFIGYRNWRKEYNKDLESVLFSTGKIHKFDREEFINWLSKTPAQARFRIRNRVMFNDKYPNLKKWFVEFEAYKEEKQKEERLLTEKIRQGTATIEDKEKLAKVVKEAKVTTGAVNFAELYEDIKNKKFDFLKIESFLKEINLPFNALTIIDDSGSMSGNPFNFATFLASVCLYKNPDDDGRNLLGMFNNTSRLYSYIDKTSSSTPNSILRRTANNIVSKPFIDPLKSFIENYKNIDKFCNAVYGSGGTNISSIPDGFKKMCDNNSEILDALMNYPVWIIISDGEWNNLYSPEASLNDFFRKCQNYFGYKPFIIAIDSAQTSSWGYSSNNKERFSGIDNFIYINDNPAQIEQVLLNFKDIDIFDIYTPLQSLYRSNRYELIRQNTL